MAPHLFVCAFAGDDDMWETQSNRSSDDEGMFLTGFESRDELPAFERTAFKYDKCLQAAVSFLVKVNYMYMYVFSDFSSEDDVLSVVNATSSTLKQRGVVSVGNIQTLSIVTIAHHCRSPSRPSN